MRRGRHLRRRQRQMISSGDQRSPVNRENGFLLLPGSTNSFLRGAEEHKEGNTTVNTLRIKLNSAHIPAGVFDLVIAATF